MKQYKKY